MKILLLHNRLNTPTSIIKILLLAGFACLMGSTLFASSQTWTGASDNNWWNAANWSDGLAPLMNKTSNIVTPGAVVNDNGGGYPGGFYVNGDTTAGAAPVLNINLGPGVGYYITNSGIVSVGGNMNNGGGIVNQTGGFIENWYGSATSLYIAASTTGAGVGSYTNVSGTYNFGGTAVHNPSIAPQVSSTSSTASAWPTDYVGKYPGETGVLLLHDYGNFYTCGQEVSGTVTTTWGLGGALVVGQSGTGTVSVTGGHMTIVTGTFQLGGSVGTATLSDTIDSTGISTITAAQIITLGAHAYFNLSLGAGFSATNGQVFTLMSTATQIVGAFANLANGGTYTSDGYAFLADYGNNFSNDTFTLTVIAVPEPSSALLVLSGLTGMGLTLRRRSRAVCFVRADRHKSQKLFGTGNKPRNRTRF